MKIKVHNDGKEKAGSFRAYVHDVDGWNGDSVEEAIEILKTEVEKKIAQLQSIDYTNIEFVDYKGDPIKK